VLPGLPSDLSVPCVEVLLVSIHQQCLILPGCCDVHVSSCAFVARVAGGFHQFSASKHTLFSNYKSIGRFIQMVHRHVCCSVFVVGKPDEALSLVGGGGLGEWW
jgi:hypothetical protein